MNVLLSQKLRLRDDAADTLARFGISYVKYPINFWKCRASKRAFVQVRAKHAKMDP